MAEEIFELDLATMSSGAVELLVQASHVRVVVDLLVPLSEDRACIVSLSEPILDLMQSVDETTDGTLQIFGMLSRHIEITVALSTGCPFVAHVDLRPVSPRHRV